MLNSLLANDAIVTGIITFFLGMLVVFFGIAIIVCVVWAVGKIFAANKEKKEQKDESEGVVTDDTVDLPPVSDGISPQIIAVITAALQAYYSSRPNGSECEFKVKKIIRRS